MTVCDEPLTVKRVVLDCPLFALARIILKHPATMEEKLSGKITLTQFTNFSKPSV